MSDATLLPQAASASTAATLSGIPKKNHLTTSETGVFVRDLTARRTVFSRNATKPLMPASTMKLVPTATALTP